ncbi:CDP-alcohol phosphatidyltransferase [Heterostelium album PN500]|uniref:CDP-alcohol phosphatidyltransferase n=1 Tax=Heterostelium pallidum (strain ATCC 26659 / Pp 5 / PN500) TaxID=670386 RepID=D3BHG8_HETP5|nr:CDP-alcohol phosphatidyltransferase [Heterostelium album PN500]EFA79145.1 CDP-alcohol phosphatidyltransferase [Heterostelium album PN500]|eukprot:XP_020431267.1 CDP-alcohol phosphatidyltransferase [Heterostelium album PN500]
MFWRISQEALTNLGNHKYSGIDDSILAKLILRRYWDLCIKLVPLWIAPNLITLTGTFAVIVSFFIVGWYSPYLDGVMPTWVYLFCAASLFFYQTMDNLDGRQARRTGTSSPLGQLFDHGCDSIVCTLQSLTAASIACYGNGFLPVFQLFMTALLPFWMATWEEYHTGTLHLGKINGPDEGIVIICLMFLSTGLFGASIWTTPLRHLIGEQSSVARLLPNVVLESKLNLLVVIALTVPTLITVVVNIRNVSRALRQKGKPVAPAMKHILVWMIMTGCAFAWYYTSTSIYGSQSIWMKNPRTVQLSIGILFGELVSRLILSHMCHIKYSVFQLPLYPLIISTLISITNFSMGVSIIEETTLLYSFSICSFIIYSIFVKETIQQLCSFLKIKCLKIPYVVSKSK